jgi:hypothetical protein
VSGKFGLEETWVCRNTDHTIMKATDRKVWIPSLQSGSGICSAQDIQGVPGGKVNIVGGHSISHSKQESVYEHVSYFKRFPR